jgi:predicted secreted protein
MTSRCLGRNGCVLRGSVGAGERLRCRAPQVGHADWSAAISAAVTAAMAGVLALPAQAQVQPPPQGVVTLTATATQEVTKDWLSVNLSTTREASDASQVQLGLKQALDAALKEARAVAKPGQLEVQTGNFSISPRYSSKGAVNGWRGTAEMVIEGRDAAAIGQLTGRIGSLSIARVSWGLSREQREKFEADVTAEASARFRVKAEQMARNFGYASYTLREVNVSANEMVPAPVFAMRAMAAAPSGDGEALPTEAGKASVSVTVSGSIQLTR